MMPQRRHPPAGLRERKKVKTRTMIQRHALRLFRDQGYEATTIGQIAEAAEISESTFFRYFPTKEDLVRWDEFDPLIVEAFRAQPVDVKAITALRGAFREVLSRLSPEEREELRERMVLSLSIPHAMGVDQSGEPMQLLMEAVAERARRSPDDFAVRILVSAVLGVGMAVMVATIKDPEADIVLLLDEAFALLEAGLPV